jgi:Cytochrome b5-like Heme/Steroid binding domain
MRWAALCLSLLAAAKNELLASSFLITRPTNGADLAFMRREHALLAVRTPFPRSAKANRVPGKNDTTATPVETRHRFDRTSETAAEAQVDIVLTIHGHQYNLTKWAKAHPGGVEALAKFRGRDATRAFEGAHHSAHAHALLDKFLVVDGPSSMEHGEHPSHAAPTAAAAASALRVRVPSEKLASRARRKLFTREDPVGVHKYLGVFCLLHFAYRYGQMLFFDPSAGLGSRPGLALQGGFSSSTTGWIAPLCLLPHAALSLSSLIFHTVPRDRVVGKPMIWQEYRVHNIAFGVRSVVTALICHLSIRMHHAPSWRRLAVVSTGLAVLATQVVADWGTHRFRANENESTTATMPYWEGCSVQTQKRFKSFYAYSQFMATLACLAVMNPAWPLAVLLAIQGASLLMTLVRKGLLTARGYHYGYTFTLLVPYAVGFRSLLYTSRPEFLAMLALGAALYQLRRRGANKYLLWIPVVAARVAVGDRFLTYDVW